VRIVHVTRELGTDRRYGIGRSLSPVILALADMGHEVRYLTQDDQTPRSSELQRGWIDRLGRWARRLWGPAPAVLAAVWLERLNMGRLAAKLAHQMRADVVHMHDPLIAWGFRLARLRYPYPALCWGLSQHGFGAYSDAIGEEGVPYTPRLLRWQRRMEARILEAADFVICPTHSGRRQLARDLALPRPAPHWHVVPHARPVLNLPCRDDARRALGWETSAVHLLAVGRLNPVKRFDRLVRACGLTGRPVQLTILAEGDEHVGRHLHELAAQSPGLSLAVHPVDDISPYLAAADLYISTARNESFGLANLEAVTAGLPAVCTAVGAVPEVVGACARLVPGGDEGLEPAMAQAISELLDDLPRRVRMGLDGRRWAHSVPLAATVAEQLCDVYAGRAPTAWTTDV